MKRPAPLPIAFALVALTGCARSLPADEETAACQALQGRALGAGVIKRAEAVAPGQKLSLAGAKAEPSVPFGFCRIEVTLSAEPGSEIQSAYWLPVKTAWNGKFFGIGNGGFGGVIMESQMFPALRNGYAVGATDLGHPASFPKTLAPMNAKWAYKQPAKLIDWAHRANHLTAEAGKEVLIAYFGQKPKRAYFHGCSDGGREALMEAGRYPQDYDGIIAGAPAAAFTDLLTQAQWNSGQAEPTNLTEEKLRRLHEAVLDRCDALDGAKDGLIENPGACRFDPEVLQCKAGDDGKRCLAKVEVEAVRAIYQGPRTRDGQQMRGFSYGSEYVTGWSLWITGPELPMVGTVKRMTGGSMLSTDFFRWMVHADPDWGREKFDFDKDLAAARQKLATTINSHELDLSPFFSRGNKLLLYHGWSDAALPAANTVDYYEKLRNRHGDTATQQSRLFMAPGMGHCMGGPGPSFFDAVGALDRWVEGGAAPEQLLATKYAEDEAGLLNPAGAKVLRTRPLCAWPRQARWNGKGSLDAAENFSCEMPKQP